MTYESEVFFKLLERDGFNIPSSVPPYESEIKAYFINQVKNAYPKLTDYEAEWLLYNYTKHLPADFPISSVTNVTNASFENVVPFAYQSAILKGCTGYRDIVTGEILETFEEGRNLELVWVKMPVLTTSNEDGTKTNILTVNEDVTLRGIGDVKDTLDCLTGEVTKRFEEINLSELQTGFYAQNAMATDCYSFYYNPQICKSSGKALGNNLPPLSRINEGEGIYISASGRINLNIKSHKMTDSSLNSFKNYLTNNPTIIQYELPTESIKTVDLKTINENGESDYFMPLEGTMHVSCNSQTIQPTFDMSVPVEATTQNLASFIDLEMEE